MHIEATPQMRMEIQVMEMLTLIGGLCSVGYINPTGAVAGVRRENSSNWIA
jgi:hypothetical protein